jgi:hypothetical protein
MIKILAGVVVACLLLAAGVALRATAAQDGTAQPGQPTQAKVWIQNRGELEAVPVTIQSVADDVPPLRVQVVGTPTVTLGAGSGQAGVVRQLWEYRDVTISAGQGPAGLLNVAGADGWETAGVTVATQAGTVVVMKRPR